MRKNFSIRVATILGAFVTVLSVGFAGSVSAAPMINYYGVDMDGACKLQGHTGAFPLNPYSPYGWFCYDTSVTAEISTSPSMNINASLMGGVNIQAWCTKLHPSQYRLSVLQQCDGLDMRPRRVVLIETSRIAASSMAAIREDKY